MKITIFGTGYVGLVVGTCLAKLDNDVICFDIDTKRIFDLQEKNNPIYEPGLDEMLVEVMTNNKLGFTSNSKFAIESSDIIFICVGTPETDSKKVNMSYVEKAAQDIGKHINSPKVIIIKSTVPVGTNIAIKNIITLETNINFDVISNPEFLKEGDAINGFLHPDRIVIGSSNELATNKILELYAPIISDNTPVLKTDPQSAELIKYASNAMLATRISFMNELSHLASKIGADITIVAKGMGLDKRIGSEFLSAGLGYGGSCFSKDINGLISTMNNHNCSYDLLRTVEQVNKRQQLKFINTLTENINLKNSRVGILGLSYKPNTSDVRNSPAISVIKELVRMGAKVSAYDPKGIKSFKEYFNSIEYANSPYDVAKNSDVILILTDWPEFKDLDLEKIKSLMNNNYIFDGRNIIDKEKAKSIGLNYFGVGR